MRNTPLAPGPGPQRRTPLGRNAEISRTGWDRQPKPGGVAPVSVLAYPMPAPVAARYTGPSAQVRRICWARLDGRCAGCGGYCPPGTWRSLQHRVARGRGGRSGPEANAYPNLIGLCGSATSPGCHLLCEQRDRRMHDRGLWLNSWHDPASVPVTLWDGRVLLLTADGGMAAYDPFGPEGAAA